MVVPNTNRVPTRERLAEIAACVLSGEEDWGVPSETDTDPWEIADRILDEFGRASPNRAVEGEYGGTEITEHIDKVLAPSREQRT